MSQRCINAFEFAGKIYPGGKQVADDDPILKSHGAFFAEVSDATVFRAAETATAGPGEARNPQGAAAEPDLKAWLAAERIYEEDVQAWLLAEEQYQADVTAWLVAEGEHEAATAAAAQEPAPQTRPAGRPRRGSGK